MHDKHRIFCDNIYAKQEDFLDYIRHQKYNTDNKELDLQTLTKLVHNTILPELKRFDVIEQKIGKVDIKVNEHYIELKTENESIKARLDALEGSS